MDSVDPSSKSADKERMIVKKQFIGKLKAGDAVDSVFVLCEKTLARKRDGAKYLTVTLSDRDGSIRGVMWNEIDSLTAEIPLGDFVQVRGAVGEYRGALQLIVKQLDSCPAELLDSADFLPATKHDIDEMFRRLSILTQQIENPDLKALIDAFWADADFVERFKTAPAAKQMHHAYIGGLLEHTLSMATLAEKIATHYAGIDRSLVLVGAVLHDIGKTEEFDYRHRIDYSDSGRLLSHIVIGLRMVEEKLAEIPDFPEETAMLLKHMIVSHHGSREFGSPELPKTLEAVLLNYIDEIDSKVTGIRNFMTSEDTGGNWTSYHRLLERHFYKGKKN